MRVSIASALVLFFIQITSFANTDYYWLQERQPEIIKIEQGLYKITYFNPNGKISETGFFKDGKAHGKWCSYDYYGNKISSVTFVDGKATGKMRMWDQNGDVISIVDYNKKEIKDYRLNENTLVLQYE